jgi:hypothetical protein
LLEIYLGLRRPLSFVGSSNIPQTCGSDEIRPEIIVIVK